MASRRRQLGGRWEKDADGSTFKLKGRVGAAHVVLCIARDAVCERVVVGTEVEMVPDPLAPKVEREVEIVEWICPESLLVGTEEEA